MRPCSVLLPKLRLQSLKYLTNILGCLLLTKHNASISRRRRRSAGLTCYILVLLISLCLPFLAYFFPPFFFFFSFFSVVSFNTNSLARATSKTFCPTCDFF